MRTCFIFLFLPFLLSSPLFAQDFAPLAIGNTWIWIDEWGGTVRTICTGQDTIEGLEYFKIRTYDPSPIYIFCRFSINDSLNYRLVQSSSDTLEVPYYKYKCILGDKWSYEIGAGITATREVIDTFQSSVFNQLVTIKLVYRNQMLTDQLEYWTDEFGMLSGVGYDNYFALKGCIINGVVYGDTTTGIGDDEPIATDFHLYQNYPNPFNPSTTIKYDLSESEFVELKVFNALGEEVAELVNEEKVPGRYSVEFKAMNLASGIYFYKINFGVKSEVKKMILLR